jgi:hypothetical protein
MDEARAVLRRLSRIEALEREGAAPGALLAEAVGTLVPLCQLALQQRLGPLDLLDVGPALGQGVALARLLGALLLLLGQLGPELLEQLDARGHVGAHDGEGVGRGLEGAGAPVEGVDVSALAVEGGR